MSAQGSRLRRSVRILVAQQNSESVRLSFEQPVDPIRPTVAHAVSRRLGGPGVSMRMTLSTSEAS